MKKIDRGVAIVLIIVIYYLVSQFIEYKKDTHSSSIPPVIINKINLEEFFKKYPDSCLTVENLN